MYPIHVLGMTTCFFFVCSEIQFVFIIQNNNNNSVQICYVSDTLVVTVVRSRT